MSGASRGYALLVVLLAIAVATGVLLRALALRPPSDPAPSALVLWHEAEAVLSRCVASERLLDDAPPILDVEGPSLARTITVEDGACAITVIRGETATVITARVSKPAHLARAKSIVRRVGERPFVVRRP